MNLNDLYAKAPYLLQSVMLNAFAAKIHATRYGKPFRRLLAQLDESQWYEPDRIAAWQSERLVALVRHAYSTTAFYRERMDAVGVRPEDVRGIQDIRLLPILEKDDIRKHFTQLVSSNYRLKDLGRGNTSGTTGSPLSIAWDRGMQLFNNVVDWRQKHWAGIRYGDRIAQILGRPIVSLERTRPPFWQTDYMHRQLWLSAFHMNPGNLRHYVAKLERFGPKAVEGYPSTMYELARYIAETRGHFPVSAVFTSSEPLLAHQRELIENTFQARVFDFYGLAERAVFATQCEAHVGQHVNFEFGILELLDESDVPVATGESGTMVATSLQNYGMPLLRYRVGDKTRFVEGRCSCGRPMQRMQCVDTKNEDQIVRPDGTVISASVLTHPFKPITAIAKSQIIQTTAREIVIRIVRRTEYGAADESRLLEEFGKRVGPEFNVRVDYVDDIARTAAGKYRWVINQHYKRPR